MSDLRHGFGLGYGDGSGYGEGSCFGFGYGDGSGSGFGFGEGSGSGYGEGSGSGYGYGYGDGEGSGSGYGYGDGGYGEVIGAVEGYSIRWLSPWPYISVGCEIHHVDWWRKNWSSVAKRNDVSVDFTLVKKLEERLCG